LEQSVYNPQNVFEQVNSRVGEVLNKNHFERQGEITTEDDGYSTVYIKDDLAYQIYMNNEKHQFLLRYCGVENDETDGKWRTRSLLLFEPEDESQIKREVESVVNDFTEEIAGPSKAAIVLNQVQKRHRGTEENTTDPVFFFNRLVPLCKDLRDDLLKERVTYGEVRGATFAKEKVLPKVQLLLESGSQSSIERLANIFSDLYEVGDLDVRSIITLVLINGLTEQEYQKLEPLFSDNLKKGAKAGLRMKGKTVKPEKKKKATRYVADSLNETR